MPVCWLCLLEFSGVLYAKCWSTQWAWAKNLLAGLAPRWPPKQPSAWVQANARRAQTPAVLASDYVYVPQSVRCLKMEMSLSGLEGGRVLKWLPCSERRRKTAAACSLAAQRRSVVVGTGPNWTLCCLGSTADGPSAGPATAALPPPQLSLPKTSLISLNINGLNAPIKRHRLSPGRQRRRRRRQCSSGWSS